MMDDTTLARIKRAKFEDVLTLRDEWGDDRAYSPKQVAAAKPVVDLDDWIDDLDSRMAVPLTEVAKLAKLKPGRVLIGEDNAVFPIAALKKVKTTRELHFTYGTYDPATLTANGVLTVGCQEWTLDQWAGYEGDRTIEENFIHSEQAKADRDIIIPILRRKLAAELKAHPAPRKRAKKAA